MENNLVSKANTLIKASYSLTLDEQRLIIAGISCCDSRKDLPDIIRISAKDYADLYGLSLKNAYSQIQEAAEKLFYQTIDFSTYDNGKEFIGKTRWLHTKLESAGGKSEGEVILKFNPDLEPYLSNLKKEYTSYRIRHVAALKSPYSIRIYEFISQHKDKGSFWLMVSDFRRIFDIQDKYKKFDGIKRRILNPVIAELNKVSDMNVWYETERKGKAVNKIIFYFSEKIQAEIDFEK